MHVITIGGATQDIFLTYKNPEAPKTAGSLDQCIPFKSGEKIEINTLSYHTGGGATNSAVSFKKQGFNVSTYCKIGQDEAGDFILNYLKSNNINTQFIHRSTTNETGRSFIINSLLGDRTIFAYRGANNHLDLKTLVCDDLQEANLLYITSLSNESAQILPSLVACAQNFNIPIAINPGASQLSTGSDSLRLALKHIKTLILNTSEAKKFVNSLIKSDSVLKEKLQAKNPQGGYSSEKSSPYLLYEPFACIDGYLSLNNFFSTVLDMGPEIIIVTNGANGVYAASKENIYYHPSIQSNVIDTVGAGDAFGACFIGSMAKGFSIEESLRLGSINSASVLEHLGAKNGILNSAQLEEKLKKIDKSLLQQHHLRQ